MTEPVILIDKDFTGGNLANLDRCMLAIAHANLVGVIPEDGEGRSDARELLEIALGTADDFPEMPVGLLNCLDYPELAERLSVYVSEYGTQCAALIFTEHGIHYIAAGCNKTPASFHYWVLGILLASGHRPTTTRADIIIRLAHDLAQPLEGDPSNPRWDEVEIRTRAIEAATATLGPLYEEWIPGFDAKDLE